MEARLWPLPSTKSRLYSHCHRWRRAIVFNKDEAPAIAFDEDEALAIAFDGGEALAIAFDESEVLEIAFDGGKAPAIVFDEDEAPAIAFDESEVLEIAFDGGKALAIAFDGGEALEIYIKVEVALSDWGFPLPHISLHCVKTVAIDIDSGGNVLAIDFESG